jgi:hypothetical protein
MVEQEPMWQRVQRVQDAFNKPATPEARKQAEADIVTLVREYPSVSFAGRAGDLAAEVFAERVLEIAERVVVKTHMSSSHKTRIAVLTALLPVIASHLRP